ncbi:MAG: hypothetical protein AAF719_10975 [Pseudomonadota bacterium]
MAKKPTDQAGGASRASTREARLAEALRANLRRRKAAQRKAVAKDVENTQRPANPDD